MAATCNCKLHPEHLLNGSRLQQRRVDLATFAACASASSSAPAGYICAGATGECGAASTSTRGLRVPADICASHSTGIIPSTARSRSPLSRRLAAAATAGLDGSQRGVAKRVGRAVLKAELFGLRVADSVTCGFGSPVIDVIETELRP
uniref:Uncharacterized protein n=1 Tax=Leersia perrieri TaxID=77586 RepID=A0A0D9X1D6_9ORYZ